MVALRVDAVGQGRSEIAVGDIILSVGDLELLGCTSMGGDMGRKIQAELRRDQVLVRLARSDARESPETAARNADDLCQWLLSKDNGSGTDSNNIDTFLEDLDDLLDSEERGHLSDLVDGVRSREPELASGSAAILRYGPSVVGNKKWAEALAVAKQQRASSPKPPSPPTVTL